MPISMQDNESPRVVAIDVGQGNTKYVMGKTSDGECDCKMFPSIAARYIPSPDSGAGASKDVVKVRSDEVEYLVGPDVRLTSRADAPRPKGSDFYMSSEHLALIRGALLYIGEEHIDLLVVGLPVDHMRTFKDKLVDRLIGTHVLDQATSVHIKQVKVVPQPLGGLVHYALRNPYPEVERTHYLTVDWGRFTLDWIISKGIKVHTLKSSSCEQGIATAIEDMALYIEHQTGNRSKSIDKLDRILRDPNYKESPIVPYKVGSHEVVNTALDHMFSNISSLEDIDQVIFVGGDPGLMLPLLKDRLKGKPLLHDSNSIFANVSGYHRIGELQVEGEKASA